MNLKKILYQNFNKLAIPLSIILFLFGCTNKTQDEYSIGVITPLSGESYSTYGNATKTGIDLAVEKINMNGGIKGQAISVVYEDSQGDPKKAINALQKLININKVPIIIGPFRSNEVKAAAPVAEMSKTLLFSASATDDSIKFAGEYIFRNVPPNKQQGITAALFILKYLGKNNVAVLFQNEDYGRSLRDGFVNCFMENGGNVVGIESFDANQRDFRTVLFKIKSLNPDVIFFPGNYEPCAIILKQARELKINIPFVGGDGANSPQLFNIAGIATQNSYYTLMGMNIGANDKSYNSFYESFYEKYSTKPDVYSAYAYDALLTIAEAIEKSSHFSADSIKESLYNLEFNGITGTTKFDSYGEVNKSFYVYEAKNSNFELLDWVPEFNMNNK